MKSLTMHKINGQMKEERISKVSLFGRRRMVLLAAVLVMMLGIAAFAKEKDWDIEMAERIGLSGAMENLEGGYVRINKSVTQDDITITAVQSIGDQNCQWIQFDTNILWEAGEGGYYMFEDIGIHFTNKDGMDIDGGAGLYSYDNNGYVSFMLDASGYKKINRANVQIYFEKLMRYENEDLEVVLVSEGRWEFDWKNYYAANTITKHPYSVVDDLLVYKLELSPVSILVEAAGLPSKEHDYLTVDSIKMQDGTTIACRQDGSVSGCSNNTFYHGCEIFEQSIDLEKIKSVTINGKEITLR